MHGRSHPMRKYVLKAPNCQDITKPANRQQAITEWSSIVANTIRPLLKHNSSGWASHPKVAIVTEEDIDFALRNEYSFEDGEYAPVIVSRSATQHGSDIIRVVMEEECGSRSSATSSRPAAPNAHLIIHSEYASDSGAPTVHTRLALPSDPTLLSRTSLAVYALSDPEDTEAQQSMQSVINHAVEAFGQFDRDPNRSKVIEKGLMDHSRKTWIEHNRDPIKKGECLSNYTAAFLSSFFDEPREIEESTQGTVSDAYLTPKMVSLHGYENRAWESCLENGTVHPAFLRDSSSIKEEITEDVRRRLQGLSGYGGAEVFETPPPPYESDGYLQESHSDAGSLFLDFLQDEELSQHQGRWTGGVGSVFSRHFWRRNQQEDRHGDFQNSKSPRGSLRASLAFRLLRDSDLFDL